MTPQRPQALDKITRLAIDELVHYTTSTRPPYHYCCPSCGEQVINLHNKTDNRLEHAKRCKRLRADVIQASA
jgi:predicted nucleic acid-binding Zn ribbon protein